MTHPIALFAGEGRRTRSERSDGRIEAPSGPAFAPVPSSLGFEEVGLWATLVGVLAGRRA